MTLEAAQRERAQQQVSGTVSITFETDSAGDVRRRIVVTELKTQHAHGKSERETRTVILERRRL